MMIQFFNFIVVFFFLNFYIKIIVATCQLSNYDGLQSKVTNGSRYVYIFSSMCSVVQNKTEDAALCAVSFPFGKLANQNM